MAGSSVRGAARWLAIGVGGAVAVYGAYVGVTWLRYGRGAPPRRAEEDPLLDRFIGRYEIVERHHIRVAAPAAVTLAAARELDLQGSALSRAIFKAREVILGAAPAERVGPRGLMAEMRAIGWGLLAEVPGRE